MKKIPLFLLLVGFLLLPLKAHTQTAAAPAQPAPADIAAAPEYKVAPVKTTYPMLRLSPDKPQIVHLDNDARSVLVGNPAHLNVIMDNMRTLVLVPRDPGATYFTVVDRNGQIIMERYVIVAGPAHKYVRIRRTCPAGAAGCTPTSVYYCPDLCYETEIMGSTQGQPTAAPAPLPGSSATPSSTPIAIGGSAANPTTMIPTASQEK